MIWLNSAMVRAVASEEEVDTKISGLVTKSSAFCTQPLHIGTRFLAMDKPRVMAILNVTPDSFYDGGNLRTESALLQRAETCLAEGANILDIGGYSSRPGATDISIDEEIQRIKQPIKCLHSHFPDALLSIDTFRVPVAKAARAAGASLINDISGGEMDKDMLPFVAQHNIPYVLMHMRGTPQTMSTHTDYTDVVSEVFTFLQKKITWLHEHGASDVLIDPGFGFAKNIAQNFTLLQQLQLFKQLQAPLLVGLSRKSMVYKTLSCTPSEALTGTAALHMHALCAGAQLLRVHDVSAAQEVITLYEALHA